MRDSAEDNVHNQRDDEEEDNDSVLLRDLWEELEYLEDTRNGKLDEKVEEEHDTTNKQKTQHEMGSIVSKQSDGVSSKASAERGKGKESQVASTSVTEMARQSTIRLAKPTEKKITTMPKQKAKRKASQQCQRSSPRLAEAKKKKKKQRVMDDSAFEDSNETTTDDDK